MARAYEGIGTPMGRQAQKLGRVHEVERGRAPPATFVLSGKTSLLAAGTGANNSRYDAPAGKSSRKAGGTESPFDQGNANLATTIPGARRTGAATQSQAALV